MLDQLVIFTLDDTVRSLGPHAVILHRDDLWGRANACEAPLGDVRPAISISEFLLLFVWIGMANIALGQSQIDYCGSDEWNAVAGRRTKHTYTAEQKKTHGNEKNEIETNRIFMLRTINGQNERKAMSLAKKAEPIVHRPKAMAKGIAPKIMRILIKYLHNRCYEPNRFFV